MKKIKIYNIVLIGILTVFIATFVYLKVSEVAYHKGRHNIQMSISTKYGTPALLVSVKLINNDGEALELYKSKEPKLISHMQYDDTNVESYMRTPTQLTVTWFSYFENKFYTGTFHLHKDKIEAAAKNINEFDIDILLLPAGKLEVAVDYNTKIAQFSATETAYKWPWKQDRQTETEATLAPDIIEPVFVKKSDSRYTLIDIQTYNKDYFRTDTYSDNKRLLTLVNNRINDTMPAGIPQSLRIGTTIDSSATHRYEFSIEFNINEVTAAYSALKQPGNKFELLIIMSDKDSLTGIEVSNKGKSKKLRNYTLHYSGY